MAGQGDLEGYIFSTEVPRANPAEISGKKGEAYVPVAGNLRSDSEKRLGR